MGGGGAMGGGEGLALAHSMLKHVSLHAERKMMDSVRLFMRPTLFGNHRHSRRSALMKTGWENTW